MIRNIFIFFILVLLSNCSFDKRSGIWTQETISLVNEENKKIKELFKKEILDENEFNPNLNLVITSSNNINKLNGNNFGALEVKSNFKKLSKYSFNKIKYFDQFEPKIVFIENDLIFFNKKGSLIRFDDKSNIRWKTNHYSKKEKKLFPDLNLTKVKKKNYYYWKNKCYFD